MFRDHRTQIRTRLYLLVCLFAPYQACRAIFCIQTVCKRKSRESESARARERETARCLHTYLLFWLVFLEYRNTMFGSVNQSCYNCFRWGPKTQIYRAHRLLYMQSRTFHSINPLCTFYRMHTFLNWRNILSWIPFGSDLDPNRVCKCRETERERERERERLVQARQSKHCIGGSTSRERERCVCVCSFWISSVCFFYSGNSSTFFKVLCRSL